MLTHTEYCQWCHGRGPSISVWTHKKMLWQISAVFLKSFTNTCSVKEKCCLSSPNHTEFRLSSLQHGGWLTVKTAVLPAFGQCKDPEYVVLLVFLLAELVPLVFYFYSVIFRGGDQRKWVDTMIRSALMFIIQRRRHYDKATLCQLSDLVHQQEAIPNFQELLEQWLNELTEKKVEVFHSLLRR